MNDMPERELDPPEETIRNEPPFERIPPIQGTLESRVSAMILHISSHNSFDKDMLITLLKDVNKAIRQADHNFRSITDTCSMIDAEIERLKSLPIGSKQA